MHRFLVLFFIIAVSGSACEKFLSKPYSQGNGRSHDIFLVVDQLISCNRPGLWRLQRNDNKTFITTYTDLPIGSVKTGSWIEAEWSIEKDEAPFLSGCISQHSISALINIHNFRDWQP
jgi:hypothetical protein